MRAIDSDALKEYIKKTDLTAVERGALLQAISNMPTLTPPNEPLTCEGCAEDGKWEWEYQNGAECPCTYCKRRAADCYRRPPEGEA